MTHAAWHREQRIQYFQAEIARLTGVREQTSGIRCRQIDESLVVLRRKLAEWRAKRPRA